VDETRRKQFKFYLGRFADSARIDGVPAAIRVNVMFKRLTWSGRRFFQYYQHNMAGWPDADLSFSAKRGLCGRALREKSHDVVYRTKAQLDAEDFGFSNEERERSKHITAVATIPLYRERKTFRGNVAYKYFGVLNVDATDAAGATLLADTQIQEQIRALAEFIQISVS
jgi:hypothetical protein